MFSEVSLVQMVAVKLKPIQSLTLFRQLYLLCLLGLEIHFSLFIFRIFSPSLLPKVPEAGSVFGGNVLDWPANS